MEEVVVGRVLVLGGEIMVCGACGAVAIDVGALP